MAPELLLGCFLPDNRINEKIDIYSFGVVMWEMWEGRCPDGPSCYGDSTYDGDSATDGIAFPDERIGKQFTFKRPCPERLKCLIEDCLQLEKNHRPRAPDVRVRLEEMIAMV